MGEDVTIVTIITTIGSILTAILGWFGDVITFLLGQPLILFGILMPVAGGLIYKAYKLIRRGGGKKKV